MQKIGKKRLVYVHTILIQKIWEKVKIHTCSSFVVFSVCFCAPIPPPPPPVFFCGLVWFYFLSLHPSLSLKFSRLASREIKTTSRGPHFNPPPSLINQFLHNPPLSLRKQRKNRAKQSLLDEWERRLS